MAKVAGRKRRSRGLTRTLFLTTALGTSLLAAPAFAADECGLAPAGGGSVECTTAGNTYDDGITYTVPDDLTVVLDDGVIDHKINAGGTNDALSITSTYTYSRVVITGANADITADAGRRHGVYVNHSYAGAQGGTTITVHDVVGQTDGIHVTGGGAANITAASATGGNSGVYVTGQTSGHGVTIHVGTAQQTGGAGVAAIRVNSSIYGDVYVQADNVISDTQGILVTGGTGAHVGVNAAVISADDIGVNTTSTGGTDIVVGHVTADYGIRATTVGNYGALNVTADAIDSVDRAVDASTTYGAINVTVTPGGHATSTSDTTSTIDASSTNGPRTVTVTTTGATVSATGGSSRGVNVFSGGSGDLVVNAGTVTTTGANTGGTADAIYARSLSVGDVTVNLGDGVVSTVGALSYGVKALGYGGGAVTVTQTAGGAVVTNGTNAMGILAASSGGAGAVTIQAAGTVATYGAGTAGTYGGANAILGYNGGSGDVSITSNQTTTYGDYSFGVEGVARNGDVTIHSTYASTQGYSAPGVGGDARHGDVTITAGTVNTSGIGSYGVIGYADDGHVSVTTTGDVTTTGASATGIKARGYAGVTITSQGEVHTGSAIGIDAASYGPVTITSNVVVSDGRTGIRASSVYDDVTVTADSTTTNRTTPGQAIEAYSEYGNVTVSAGVVNADHGSGVKGVVAVSYYGDVAVTAQQVSSGSTGIYAQSYYGSARATVTPGGHVTTFGNTAEGVYALAVNTGDATIVATGATIVTTGAESDGLRAVAGYDSGNAAITGGTVTTSGSDSRGVSAISYQGTASANVQSVTTAGDNSIGVRVRAYGDASATVGTVQTAGAYSNGVDVRSSYGAATATVTSATTTGDSATGVRVVGYSAAAVTVGTVQTSGTYSYGVNVSDFHGPATVTVTSAKTAGDFAPGVEVRAIDAASVTVGAVQTAGTYGVGVDVRSYYGAATAKVTSATTAGDYADGVNVRGYQGASATVGTVQTAGAYSYGVNVRSFAGPASATVTSVTTAGYAGVGVKVRGHGDASATVGTVQTAGAFAYGVDVRSSYGAASASVTSVTTTSDVSYGVTVSGYGDAKATVGTVITSGVDAYGVGVFSETGNASVTSTSVTTTGSFAQGVAGAAYQGSVTIASGTVRTSGAYSRGIVADAPGDIHITSTDVGTTGDHSGGIVVFDEGAGPAAPGSVTVTSGTVSTTGAISRGIEASVEGVGSVTINAATTTTSGADSAGIVVSTTTGNITGTVGTLTSASDGVLSYSKGSTQTWTLGNVTAAGGGIYVKNAAGHSTTLNLTNVTAGTFAAMVDEDAATVNIASGGAVKGGSAFGVGFNAVEAATVNNAGALSASNGLAVVASSNSGPITINNTGSVTGAVSLGGGADTFSNSASGVFAAGASDFGAGSDVLNNSGVVSLDAGQTPVTVTLGGLEQFNNTGGLVDLRGRGAGDRLVLPGGFAGSGDSRVGLDVFLGGPASPSDVLQVGGAVTGSTTLQIHDTNTGSGALAPDGIVVVDANAGSVSPGAFRLADGPINKGLFTYDLYLRNDKRYVLASRWSPTAEQGPFLTTALENLFQETQGNIDDRLGELRAFDMADSRTVQLAALTSDASGPLPRGRAGDNGVWLRLTAGANDRVASHAQTVLGVTTVDNLNFNQSYVAFQGGVDHAFRGAGGTWMAGASLGYLDSDGSFTKGGTFAFTGPTAALYLEYLKGGLFGEVTARGDWLNLKYRSLVGTVSPNAHTYGVSGTMGYRMHGPGWFAEPEGSLSYGVGRIDNFTLGGAGFVFHDGETLRGRAALNLGKTFMVNHGSTIIEPTVTAAAVKEFLGANTVDVLAGPGLRIGDGAKPAWGEFGGGVKIIDTASGFSAFVQGKYEGASKINTGFGFKAGVRFTF